MQKMGLNELREKFLEFFESKGHLRLKSYSLVPDGDKSLLLINSGMAPMKKYFTGEVTPPRKRVATCQKCIRTPDIERVGITARHGTYFEMLGNFSFGDYFKKEACSWAWEFFTKELSIPVDKLHCSVYVDDNEAYDIWTKEIGVDPSHMHKLGKEDNFWEHGAGPCGPCSEIYFDRGEESGCGSPDCKVGCECDRFMEVWNLVFTQFDSDGKGNYTPLENPNIDTGMGLERLACVMQDVGNLFLVDTMQDIMKHISKISGVNYGDSDKTDISLRVITDHIRSTVFMMGDGVRPSSEGRGYVLRRLLRRAARHGKLLGVNEPFLSKIANTVVDCNKNAYPELLDKMDMIVKLIDFEEENFHKTIDQGLALLSNLVEEAKNGVLSGDHAFKLNDTYGFPIDLTKEILGEKGIMVDEDRFRALLMKQRERARNARKNAGADAWKGSSELFEGIAATEFVGYEEFKADAKILAIVKDSKLVSEAYLDDEVAIVLDTTPFYAESGGQVGDSGVIEGKDFNIDVSTTTKNADGIYIHTAIVEKGEIKVGDPVKAMVNVIKRRAIMRNHTAAHMLQAVLKKVLGNHVEQAGQLVDEKRMRFDFTHFSAVDDNQIIAIETLINAHILSAHDVTCEEMTIEEARKKGAIALFGEKYGDIVRVVSVGEYSKEFCGGTHVDNTSKLGLFKIVSESSVASGVRRIEAVTGAGVLKLIHNTNVILNETATALKAQNTSDIPNKAKQVVADLKKVETDLKNLNEKISKKDIESVFENAMNVNGIKIVSAIVNSADSNALKSMCDSVKDRGNTTDTGIVGVFIGVMGEKASIAVSCSKLAMEKGLKSGLIAKEVAQVTGGNGGGKPDFAMAGAKDITKLDEAVLALPKIIEKMM